MKKRFWALLLSMFVFSSLCSPVQAKTCLEAANEDLAAIQAISEIQNPELQIQAIKDFMNRIKPAIKQAVEKSDLRKFAWNIGGSRWWIIYESKKHSVASAWLCKGDPPRDAKIL